MSWIDRELRRRQKQDVRSRGSTSIGAASASMEDESRSIAALWARIEQANAELPPELQLPRLATPAVRLAEEFAACNVLLKAANGAGIGFTGSAIRYVWPKKRLSKSNNFWIKGHVTGGYVVSRRVKTSMPGITMQDGVFDERSIERILRCLVTARQVTSRAVTRRRFFFF